MKNVLITGGAGFIGSNIAIKLIEKGYNVRILDNLSHQVHGDKVDIPFNLRSKVEFIKGDVRNREDWKIALKAQDAVIHLAAETGTGQSMYEIHKYTDTNIGGTALLLDILTNEVHNIKKVIVSSSRAVYGEGKYRCRVHEDVYPLARKKEDLDKNDFNVKCPFCGENVDLCATTEDSQIHPTSIYGITKQVQEEIVMVTCSAINIPFVVFRYQNVYGPGQSLINPYTGILSIFSNLIRNDQTINIFEDGLESRDFVYIDDVADATICGLEQESANNGVFNVGSGVCTDVKTVVDLLQTAYGKKVNKYISGNYRIGDIRHNYASVDNMKESLKFNARVSMEVGIKNFTEWVVSQEKLSNSYEASLSEMKLKGLMK
jgi:dTDP-L-rhamnose 4-epimerase